LFSKWSNSFYVKYLLAIFAVGGGYSVLFISDSFSNHQHKTFCFFKLGTGIPCPGCGMGRATLEMIHGNFVSSFNYNILCIPFTLVIIISLLWLSAYIVQKKETFFPFINSKIKLSYKILLFAILAAAWVTNIFRQV
jgi:hypothetical protein